MLYNSILITAGKRYTPKSIEYQHVNTQVWQDSNLLLNVEPGIYTEVWVRLKGSNPEIKARWSLDVTVVGAPVTGGVNLAPTANAGSDLVLAAGTTTTQLLGTGSDSDGSISAYQWAQLSGPATATFSSRNVARPYVGNLGAGTFVFQLTVTDNAGRTSVADEVNVTVLAANAANALPVAQAGSDLSIQLPLSSVVLAGAGSDSDGTIASYRWTQLLGPQPAQGLPSTSASTVISGLVAGAYQFRLTVTDNQGGTASDDVALTVQTAAPAALVYNTPLYGPNDSNGPVTLTALGTVVLKYNGPLPEGDPNAAVMGLYVGTTQIGQVDFLAHLVGTPCQVVSGGVVYDYMLTASGQRVPLTFQNLDTITLSL